METCDSTPSTPPPASLDGKNAGLFFTNHNVIAAVGVVEVGGLVLRQHSRAEDTHKGNARLA
jgi:hypothetical protein